jgi:hypothetical protein
VRTEKVRLPSWTDGEEVDTVVVGNSEGNIFGAEGISGIKVPGANEGARILKYQPRLGRCIVHRNVFVALS